MSKVEAVNYSIAIGAYVALCVIALYVRFACWATDK